MPSPHPPNQSFEAFYERHLPSIAGYVQRRVASDDSEDIVAQVFLVAWRRFEEIPVPPADRLWLFGVARRMVADHRRSTFRRRRLHERLLREAKTPGRAPATSATFTPSYGVRSGLAAPAGPRGDPPDCLGGHEPRRGRGRSWDAPQTPSSFVTDGPESASERRFDHPPKARAKRRLTRFQPFNVCPTP